MTRQTSKKDVEFVNVAGFVFGLVNTHVLAPVPKSHSFDPNNDDLPDPSTFRKLEYRTDRDFYLAYCLQNPRFSAYPLLQCLDFARGSFPVEGSLGTFYLSPSLQEKWSALEGLLHSTSSLLQSVCFRSQPLYMTIYWPCLYGYRGDFSTYHIAQHVAWKSREAFLAVFAYIGLLIDRFTVFSASHGHFSAYLSKQGLPMSVIEMLGKWGSSSADMKRVGAFVHPYQSGSWTPQWLRELPYIHNAPLWFPYGHITTTTEKLLPIPKRFLPPPQSQINLLSGPPAPTSSLALPAPLVTGGTGRSEPAMDATFPEPLRGSGQLRGETWRQFFERRAKQCAQLERTEVKAQKTGRLQRKSQYDGASGQVMPSLRSTSKVFYWERVEGASDGFRIRTRIDKVQWEDYWRNRNGQRRYNEFFNEWDICSDFGDDAMRWDDLDDEDDDFDPEAFRLAQEEEAKRRVERVKEIKRGLEKWKGWRIDIAELRQAGAAAGGYVEYGPVFEV